MLMKQPLLVHWKGGCRFKMVPNILTIGRIILTPVFIICLFYEASWAKPAALVIFIVAAITDAWDGHIARKKDMVTKTGAFLDPLADKLLVSSAFISFAIMGKIPYWMVGLIVFRDLFITGLRMLFVSRGLAMRTSKVAKLKTGVQISAIIFILIYLSLNIVTFFDVTIIKDSIDQFNLINYAALLVTFFTVYTGISYLYTNREAVKEFMTLPRHPE